MAGDKYLMTTSEVAEFLRLKERKIYDMVQKGEIPCTRVTGKWLFPRDMVEAWLRKTVEAGEEAAPPPPVLSGSHDPLLDWALRASGSGLATMCEGSLVGLDQFADRKSVATGMHLRDPETGDYNSAWVASRFADWPAVLIHWAAREQGLIVPKSDSTTVDMAAAVESGARIAVRPRGTGTRVLFEALVRQAGGDPAALEDRLVDAPSETDLAHLVQDGSAQVAFGVAAATAYTDLAFIPLAHERFDILMKRRDFFEPPMQALFSFTRSREFLGQAAKLPGYDISDLGTVVWNA
jgi:excisionase family DNA binding protein